MKLCGRSHLVAGFVAVALALLGVELAGAASPTAARPVAKPTAKPVPRPVTKPAAKPVGKRKTPAPKAGAARPPADTAGRRFGFEKRTGALDQALSTLVDRERPMLPSAEDAGERMARAASARQVVRSNAKAAAAALVAELGTLQKSDVEGHAELFSLLGVVEGEDAAIDYWSRKLNTGTPRPARPTPERKKLKQPDQPRAQRSEREDPEVVIRYLAIARLYRAARAGSQKARAAVLAAAASPHREVRITAVQYTYALLRRRWKARLELEKLLPQSERYLLYRH